MLAFGKVLLEKEIREYGFDPFKILNTEGLEEAAHACCFKSIESMFAGIGIGKLSTYHILEKLLSKELQRKLKFLLMLI